MSNFIGVIAVHFLCWRTEITSYNVGLFIIAHSMILRPYRNARVHAEKAFGVLSVAVIAEPAAQPSQSQTAQTLPTGSDPTSLRPLSLVGP